MNSTQQGYKFDDVLLVPQHSQLPDRSAVTTQHKGLGVPIYSAAMDTVTEVEMIEAMRKEGAEGIHHRYTNKNTLKAIAKNYPVAVSPSVGDIEIEGGTLFIDVAHGDTEHIIEYASQLAQKHTVFSGNVVTPEAAKRYWNAGVENIKIGVGPGYACTTREVAGVGYPQLSAIMNIRNELPDAYLVADGGIRTGADIVKALAAGADAVIVGFLFAGCKESARGVSYRGMASKEAREDAGKEVEVVEGRNSTNVAGGNLVARPVKEVIDELVPSIKAGLAYCGAENISELQNVAEFVTKT